MARDLIHEAVKTALKKDGWTITDDPFRIQLKEEGRYLEADLGVERFFKAKKGSNKILVEIKSFSGASIINQFHNALGQYLMYKTAIKGTLPQRTLYLAITVRVLNEIEQISLIQEVIQEYNIKLIIVDTHNKKIESWID